MTVTPGAGSGRATGGLVAVHAHPDDETLSTGGLLAVWAQDGRPVTVVTCTRGELGEVIPVDLAHLEGDGAALAAHREAELTAAMGRLGVLDHVFLDTVPAAAGGPGPATPARYVDSGMAWAGTGRAAGTDTVPDGAFVGVPLDDAAVRLARVLRDRRPDVVVTYEPGGGYGHPDHVQAHRVAVRALGLAAGDVPALADLAPYDVPVVLWAAVADDVLRRAYADLPTAPAVRGVLRDDPRLTLPDPHGPVPSTAVDPGDVALSVDVTGVLDRVAAALGEHRTQVAAVAVGAPAATPTPARTASTAPTASTADAVADAPVLAGCYALSNHVLAPLLTHESYRFAPGYPHRRVVWPAAVRPVR